MLNLILGLWVLLESACPAQQWESQTTWVFAVSCGVYKHDESLNMEMKNRRDEVLVKTLQKRGVPSQQIVFLKDAQTAHDNTLAQLKSLLSKTRPGDTLLFYFQGHGQRDIEDGQDAYEFVVYDSDPETGENYFTMQELFDRIQSDFRGSRLILTADCCYAGGLLTLASRPSWTLPTACLASVNAHNQSTGEWTFTDGLIRGFAGNGRADLNRDGTTTFGELGHYLELEMAFLEKQKATFATFNGFDPSLTLAQSSPEDRTVGQHVLVDTEDGPARAEVVESDGKGKFRVVYAEFEGDDWLAKSDLLPYRLASPLVVGTPVKAFSESQEEWREAQVLANFQQLHLVHFQGLPSLYDEWVSPEHVKSRVAAPPRGTRKRAFKSR